MAKIVILSGAGISAESGISTFRDSNGLWENYNVEDICNFDSLQKNENLTLQFYDQRRTDLEDKIPNHAHRRIAQLEEKYKDAIAIITQNVDNLFEKAGINHEDIIHLHGFLTEVRCHACESIYDIQYKSINSFHNGKCPKCNHKLRPNIVFFGESAPKYELLNYHLNDCELLVIIGTSGNVIEVNNMAQSIKQSILNNLEPNWMINDENFSKVIYNKATIAIDDIYNTIEDYYRQTNETIWETQIKISNPYEKIQTAKKLIQEADAILITAGAGMGVDSGLPDFRGNEGLWKAYPPLKKAGYEFTQVESGHLFRKNPKLAWGFYGHRLNLYRETKPHKGFKLLYDLVDFKNNNYFIFTSNVDAQFQKAGFDEDKIYEVHGSIEYLQCIDNCNNKIYDNDLKSIDVNMEILKTKDVPYCKDCSKVIVPNILLFGGTTFNETRTQEQNKRFLQWLSTMKGSKVIILEIGAGKTVPTIRNFNDSYSKRHENFKLVRINPIENEVLNNGDIGIRGRGLGIIKKLIKV
jgi:NAD-dependent deacetylase